MEDTVYNAIERYLNTLSAFGYMSYCEVDKLLVLMFIQELMDSNCKTFITEDEYRTISNVLYCLYGSSCLIPYPEYIAETSLSCPKK